MEDRKKMLRINLARAAGIGGGIVFIFLGISRGEPMEVLGKAVRICLECIGIG